MANEKRVDAVIQIWGSEEATDFEAVSCSIYDWDPEAGDGYADPEWIYLDGKREDGRHITLRVSLDLMKRMEADKKVEEEK